MIDDHKINADVINDKIKNIKYDNFEKGYNETSISDIAKECGLAHGTFYYYFKTKDEVFVFYSRAQRNLSKVTANEWNNQSKYEV